MPCVLLSLFYCLPEILDMSDVESISDGVLPLAGGVDFPETVRDLVKQSQSGAVHVSCVQFRGKGGWFPDFWCLVGGGGVNGGLGFTNVFPAIKAVWWRHYPWVESGGEGATSMVASSPWSCGAGTTSMVQSWRERWVMDELHG